MRQWKSGKMTIAMNPRTCSLVLALFIRCIAIAGADLIAATGWQAGRVIIASKDCAHLLQPHNMPPAHSRWQRKLRNLIVPVSSREFTDDRISEVPAGFGRNSKSYSFAITRRSSRDLYSSCITGPS